MGDLIANPPYIYLKRNGSNANSDLDINNYAYLNSSYISSPVYSGSKLGYNLIGRNDTQAASGSHRHKLSGMSDLVWTSDTEYLNSGLQWDGSNWIAVSSTGGGDISTTLTLATASGISSDVTIKHDGVAGTLYLVDIPQNIIKSGSEYWNGYLSGQLASYSDVAWSGASGYYGFSSNTKQDILDLFNTSSALDSRIDTLEGYDVFDHTLYSLSSNLYNQIWIDTFSGNIDTRLDDLEDNDEFEHEYYITSSNAISRFPGSSNVNRALIDSISSNIDTRVDILFNWSSNAINLYYDSGAGAGTSGTVVSLVKFSSNSRNLYTASSQVNRTLLDTISSNLDAKIDAISDTPTNWGTLTEGTGVAPITNVGVSGSGDHDITVLGYATISSNAQWSQNWLNTSGSQLSNFLASGDEYSAHVGTTHDYSYISTNDGATDVTATELEELTNGSETTLHSHAYLPYISSTRISGTITHSTIIKKVADYTATIDDSVILCSSQSAITIDLPAVAGATGKILNIKNLGTGTVYISGSDATELIDKEKGQYLDTQYENLTVVCDSLDWYIL